MTTPVKPHIDPYLDEMALAALQTYLAEKLAKFGVRLSLAIRELTVVTPKENLLEVLQMLRDDPKCKFTQLMDLCGVDWLGQRPDEQRFAVVYHLLSLEKNLRIRVQAFTGLEGRVDVTEGPDIRAAEPVPSVAGLYAAATWYERETWDMFGIPFTGNDDLRRLLTDYDFVGHPLRKDFPLNGYTEVYYDSAQGRVAYKPVDLPQEFRHFDRVSEWEGMTENVDMSDAFDGKAFK